MSIKKFKLVVDDYKHLKVFSNEVAFGTVIGDSYNIKISNKRFSKELQREIRNEIEAKTKPLWEKNTEESDEEYSAFAAYRDCPNYNFSIFLYYSERELENRSKGIRTSKVISGISFENISDSFLERLLSYSSSERSQINLKWDERRIAWEIYKGVEPLNSLFLRNLGLLRKLENKIVKELNEISARNPLPLYSNKIEDRLELCDNELGLFPGEYWFYDGWIYKATREYTQEEARLLILDEVDKERRNFERLKRKFDETYADEIANSRRERIPESVRIEVWRRDGGKCVRCGSRENLEYDHIIPVSKGGSNTARNIELLCEKCNRAKHDKIE